MQITGFFRRFGKCGQWRRRGMVGLVGLAIFSLAPSAAWSADPAPPVFPTHRGVPP
jgi:hypothetical protein